MDKQRFIVHLDSGAEPGTWNVRLRLDDRSEAKKDDESGDDERRSPPTIFQLLRDGSIELVDAFPPVKLSHAQCLSLCEGISDAIRD